MGEKLRKLAEHIAGASDAMRLFGVSMEDATAAVLELNRAATAKTASGAYMGCPRCMRTIRVDRITERIGRLVRHLMAPSGNKWCDLSHAKVDTGGRVLGDVIDLDVLLELRGDTA